MEPNQKKFKLTLTGGADIAVGGVETYDVNDNGDLTFFRVEQAGDRMGLVKSRSFATGRWSEVEREESVIEQPRRGLSLV